MVWKPKRGEEKIRWNIKKCIHLRYKSFQQHAIVSLHPSPIHWLCSYLIPLFIFIYNVLRAFIFVIQGSIHLLLLLTNKNYYSNGTKHLRRYIRTHARTHAHIHKPHRISHFINFLWSTIYAMVILFMCTVHTHTHTYIFWSMARCGESYHDITNIVEPQWASRFWEMKQKWKTNDVIDTQS